MRKLVGLKLLALLVAALGLALAVPPPEAGLKVIEPLVKAKQMMAEDPVAAVQVIEEAQKKLDEYLKELGAPPAAAKAVKQAYTEAIIAVGRRSAPNADARIWVVRGVVGKIYYDALFPALAAGDVAAAERALEGLAKAVAMDQATYRKALALLRAKDVEGLRRVLERSFADRIARSLYQAELELAKNKNAAAYAAAAKAYGLFLVVQDSPTFASVAPDEFLQALNALAEGRRDEFLAKVRELRQRFRDIVAKIDTGEPLPTMVYLPKGVKAETQAPPPPPPKPQEEHKAFTVKKPRREAAQPTFATPRWLDPGRRKVILSLAQSMGYEYVTDLTDRIVLTKDAIGNATAALAAGKFDEAHSYLNDAAWIYLFHLSPLFAVADPQFDEAVSRALVRLQDLPGLRTSDLTVLANAVNAMEQRYFRGTPPPRSTAFQLSLLNLAGPPRMVMFLLAGLLALLPLYLTRRAFSQRAAYWRALGFALTLLLLPAITEALSYVGEYLALKGYAFGASLVSLSIFQSLAAQMAWGLLVIVVVIAATWGLWGIAAQFGFAPFQFRLGRRRAAAAGAPTAEEAVEEVEWE